MSDVRTYPSCKVAALLCKPILSYVEIMPRPFVLYAMSDVQTYSSYRVAALLCKPILSYVEIIPRPYVL